MIILWTAIGVISIIYGISCLIQSFRHEDSSVALAQDGIFEDAAKTSRRLRLMAFFFLALGIVLLFVIWR
jgi:hypothetical protein